MRATLYMAGEIHTPWREEIAARLDRDAFTLVGPVTDHDASDACGTTFLGPQPAGFFGDQVSAGVNAVRTRTLIERADAVVARFAAKFGEWGGALDSGIAVAKGKPLITLHDAELDHWLKEVDRAALVVCRTPEQVARVLRYAYTQNP